MNKIAFVIGSKKVEYISIIQGKRSESNFFEIKRKTKDQILDAIAKIINKLNINNIMVRISSPTAVDSKSGFCKGISSIKEYANFNLYDELKLRLNVECDIVAMNEANVALKGMLISGFAKKPHSALMISLGSGIGGSLYINGEIFQGFDNMAGEIGYPIWKGKKNISLSISPIQKFKKEIKMFGGDIFSSYLVDPIITEKLNDWTYELSKIISMYAFCVNPEVVVFSGPITEHKTFQLLLTSMYEKYLKNNFLDNLLSTKIVFCEEGINYPLEGAISL